MKKKLCCQFDDTIEVDFLLGINIWGLRSEWVKVIPLFNQCQIKKCNVVRKLITSSFILIFSSFFYFALQKGLELDEVNHQVT